MGLKVNTAKSLFCIIWIKYLDYIINCEVIKPCENKIKAILDLEPPKNLKELCKTLGIVQFCRDMWENRMHVLSLLIDLVWEYSIKTGSNKKENYKEVCIAR